MERAAVVLRFLSGLPCPLYCGVRINSVRSIVCRIWASAGVVAARPLLAPGLCALINRGRELKRLASFANLLDVEKKKK
jgi:hypothetical protein